MSDQHQKQQLRKIILMMRIVFYAQFATVAIVGLYLTMRLLIEKTMPDLLTYIGLLVLLTIMVFMNGFFLMRDKNLFISLSDRLEHQGASYENVKELNTTLRAQRHDFLNHIQVLYTLMELGEHEETKEYLDNLYEDVGRISSRIKTKSVAVNALLQAKGNEAQKRGINLGLQITTRFDQFSMPDWEVCRVIANVIDNAFDATEAVAEPKVSVALTERLKSYELLVTNECMPIHVPNKEVLFEAGYTTKKEEEGHGMGLFIIKQLMDKYHGHIDFDYNSGKVQVTVSFPKVTIET